MTKYEFTVQVLSVYFQGEKLIDAICITLNVFEWEAKRLLEQVEFQKKRR
jgi:hypothetical protein